MSGIAWTDFSWESFATLTTGVLAVAGAVSIGFRQAAIARRQTEIMAQQARVAELSLRHNLFERRMEVYTATQAFVEALLIKAQPPENPVRIHFLEAIDRSRFLFGEAVTGELKNIWAHGIEFEMVLDDMRDTYCAEGHYGDGNPDKKRDSLQWFSQKLRDLPEVFGDELRLA